ncbi:hypothetical protein L0F63_002381 [Massospora cicadina]|nr:hypothetical protein L0F63_002381 [Massospora cicadina]
MTSSDRRGRLEPGRRCFFGGDVGLALEAEAGGRFIRDTLRFRFSSQLWVSSTRLRVGTVGVTPGRRFKVAGPRVPMDAILYPPLLLSGIAEVYGGGMMVKEFGARAAFSFMQELHAYVARLELFNGIDGINLAEVTVQLRVGLFTGLKLISLNCAERGPTRNVASESHRGHVTSMSGTEGYPRTGGERIDLRKRPIFFKTGVVVRWHRPVRTAAGFGLAGCAYHGPSLKGGGSPVLASWSSQNLIALAGPTTRHPNPGGFPELQVLVYEATLSNQRPSKDLLNESCLSIPLAGEAMPAARYRVVGLAWNDAGTTLAVVDEMGALQILGAESLNTYRQLFLGELDEPVVSLAWLPTARKFSFDFEAGVTRKPLLGPTNPLGGSALVGLTPSGRVVVVYQHRGCAFQVAEGALPFSLRASGVAWAEILMGPAGQLFLVIQPKHLAQLHLVSATLCFEDPVRFNFRHLKSCVSKVPIQGFDAQAEDGVLTVAMFGPSADAPADGSASSLLDVIELLPDRGFRRTEASVAGQISTARFVARRRILLGLTSGELQVRECGDLGVIRVDSVSSLLAGPCGLFAFTTPAGHLTRLELSPNRCVGLALTSGGSRVGIFDLIAWLETSGQEAVLQARLPCIINGINQGTDLVDVVSCFCAEPSLQPDVIVGRVATLLTRGDPVPPPLVARIMAFHALLYRYSRAGGKRSMVKVILASRLQHARDLLLASQTGDRDNPTFPPAAFPRIVPSAVWVLYMLIFLFRDMYLYYSTKVLQVDGTVTGFADEVSHLAVLAHPPSRGLIMEVVAMLQALNAQVTKALPELTRRAGGPALAAARCWAAEWERLPVPPIVIVKFYTVMAHNFDIAWKNAKLPPETWLPRSMPRWAQDFLERMRVILMEQFAAAWGSTLALDTTWLALGVAAPFPLASLQPRGLEVNRSTPEDLGWLRDPVVAPLEVPIPPQGSQPGSKIDPATPPTLALPGVSPRGAKLAHPRSPHNPRSRSFSSCALQPTLPQPTNVTLGWPGDDEPQERKRFRASNLALVRVCLRCHHPSVPISEQWGGAYAEAYGGQLPLLPSSHAAVGISAAACPCGGPWAYVSIDTSPTSIEAYPSRIPRPSRRRRSIVYNGLGCGELTGIRRNLYGVGVRSLKAIMAFGGVNSRWEPGLSSYLALPIDPRIQSFKLGLPPTIQAFALRHVNLGARTRFAYNFRTGGEVYCERFHRVA